MAVVVWLRLKTCFQNGPIPLIQLSFMTLRTENFQRNLLWQLLVIVLQPFILTAIKGPALWNGEAEPLLVAIVMNGMD